MTPTIGQLVLLGLSTLLLAIGGGISLYRLRSDRPSLRVVAKACMYGGLVAAVAILVWHAQRRGNWQLVTDNFEALIWLAVLLALFVMYMQRFRPIPGLDWFVMPIVVLLLVAAGLFGSLVEPHPYEPLVRDAWLWTHHVSAYGGAVAFAIAAAGGAMYVIASRRLRRKKGPPLLGSLERLERMMMVSVTLGFALLTIGMITGFERMLSPTRDGETPHAKLLLASLAWLVYAVVMHAPINPRFRGRRAAILSVLGFLLVAGTLVAVQFMPGGKG